MHHSSDNTAQHGTKARGSSESKDAKPTNKQIKASDSYELSLLKEILSK
jgi:hypothetical protein